MTSTAPPICAPIRADELYRLATFRRILGVGQKWIRSAQRDGLRVIVAGNARFVRGTDALAYFDRLAAREVSR